MQERKIIERGLGNAALGEQSEATVERSLDDALLLEAVRKGPVTHHLLPTGTVSNRVGQVRYHVCAISDLRLITVVGVVFGPDEGHMRVGRGGDLLMHLFYGAADHLIARDVFVGAEDVF